MCKFGRKVINILIETVSKRKMDKGMREEVANGVIEIRAKRKVSEIGREEVNIKFKVVI